MLVFVQGDGDLSEGGPLYRASFAVGEALAETNHQIFVQSEDPGTIDTAVLEGYISKASDTRLDIEQKLCVVVGYSPTDQRADRKFEAYRQSSDVTFIDITASPVDGLRRADALLILGGSSSTEQFVEIARALNKQIIPIGSFGGVAGSMLQALRPELKQRLTEEEIDALAHPYTLFTAPRAKLVVTALEKLPSFESVKDKKARLLSHVDKYSLYFWRKAAFSRRIWWLLTIVNVTVGFVASLVALVLDANQLATSFYKGIITILPFLGSTAATLLVTLKVRDNWVGNLIAYFDARHMMVQVSGLPESDRAGFKRARATIKEALVRLDKETQVKIIERLTEPVKSLDGTKSEQLAGAK